MRSALADARVERRTRSPTSKPTAPGPRSAIRSRCSALGAALGSRAAGGSARAGGLAEDQHRAPGVGRRGGGPDQGGARAPARGDPGPAPLRDAEPAHPVGAAAGRGGRAAASVADGPPHRGSELVRLQRDERPHRAGGRAAPPGGDAPARSTDLLTLSARSAPALRALAERWAGRLREAGRPAGGICAPPPAADAPRSSIGWRWWSVRPSRRASVWRRSREPAPRRAWSSGGPRRRARPRWRSSSPDRARSTQGWGARSTRHIPRIGPRSTAATPRSADVWDASADRRALRRAGRPARSTTPPTRRWRSSRSSGRSAQCGAPGG